MHNIHFAAIKRLFLGWALISALVGGGAYWYGLRQISEQAVQLARTEVTKVAPAVLTRVNGYAAELLALQLMTYDYQSQGFAIIEIYNRRGQMVAENVAPTARDIEAALIGSGYTLYPEGREIKIEHITLAHNDMIRVVMPLLDGDKLEGHLAGIYIVPADKLAALKLQGRHLLIAVFIVILFTTVLLYPFIISLNRKVTAEAHALLRSNLELMNVLGSAIAKRDSDTNSHNFRVTLYAVRLGEIIGMHKRKIRDLVAGAMLHDVGKIGIHDDILLKPGKLNDEEFKVMKQHVTLGLEIISHSNWLHRASEIVGSHHEWYDGNGYPNGLAGEKIPLAARVFAIVDVFDALASRRPYKGEMTPEQALVLMDEQSGSHFDPALLQAFHQIALDLYEKYGKADDRSLEHVQRAVVERYWNEGEEDPFPKPGPIGSITARLRNMFDAKLQAER
jgi:HD-GYP domain-containing protein (c-di-GMP phosphodiesterase class II)